jgi:hypothetical protein
MSGDFPIGATIVTTDSEDIRAEATRTDENTVIAVYTNPATEKRVLVASIEIDTGNVTIDTDQVDESFWSLIVDGEERSASDLKKSLNEATNPGAYIDGEERLIKIYSQET